MKVRDSTILSTENGKENCHLLDAKSAFQNILNSPIEKVIHLSILRDYSSEKFRKGAQYFYQTVCEIGTSFY